jgi:hypothetical protein
MGTPPHIMQAIAGHSHIDVTMRMYTHSSVDDQTRALLGLGEVLGGAGRCQKWMSAGLPGH